MAKEGNIYTDQSLETSGNQTTAGVALESSDHIGVANTIQIAELVGIYKALSIDHAGSDLHPCTDSLFSMYMIDEHMRCPSLHKECKHEELLVLIVEALAAKAREGVHVQLLKVMFHIGIEGNEMADKLWLMTPP